MQQESTLRDLSNASGFVLFGSVDLEMGMGGTPSIDSCLMAVGLPLQRMSKFQIPRLADRYVRLYNGLHCEAL
jgi:hypothetical protein